MTQYHLTGLKDVYIFMQRLGTAGLYGQAFLARRDSDGTEVVIKELRQGAPADGSQVLAREAQTLMRVAEAESRRGVRFAVRLLDRDPNGTFIVMERAVGLNLKDDLLQRIPEWSYSVKREAELLPIMLEFARALQCVHDARLTYNDMKLDNLFWVAERHQLRIIDWNVVREISEVTGAVSIDWARFGARLYEVYTGEALILDAEGNLQSRRPSGQRWESLPAGVQMLIERALARGYEDDAQIIADLEREQAGLALMQQGLWLALLQEAESAEATQQQAQAILSPAGRAEMVLAALPQDDTAINATRQLSTLRSRVAQRVGRANERQLDDLFNMLRGGQVAPSIVRGLFVEAYKKSGNSDTRARRGIWICDAAQEAPLLWQRQPADLVDAVTGAAGSQSATRLSSWAEANSSNVLRRLAVEIEIETARAADNSEQALKLLALLPTAEVPDLAALKQVLENEQREAQQRRSHAADAERNQRLAAEAIAAAEQAEQAGDLRNAINGYYRAVQAIAQSDDSAARKRLIRRIAELEARQVLRDLGQRSIGQVDRTALISAIAALGPELRLDDHLRAAFEQAERDAQRAAVAPSTGSGQLENLIQSWLDAINMQLTNLNQSVLTSASQRDAESLKKQLDSLRNDLTGIARHIGIATGQMQPGAPTVPSAAKPGTKRTVGISGQLQQLSQISFLLPVNAFLLILVLGAVVWFGVDRGTDAVAAVTSPTPAPTAVPRPTLAPTLTPIPTPLPRPTIEPQLVQRLEISQSLAISGTERIELGKVKLLYGESREEIPLDWTMSNRNDVELKLNGSLSDGAGIQPAWMILANQLINDPELAKDFVYSLPLNDETYEIRVEPTSVPMSGIPSPAEIQALPNWSRSVLTDNALATETPKTRSGNDSSQMVLFSDDSLSTPLTSEPEEVVTIINDEFYTELMRIPVEVKGVELSLIRIDVGTFNGRIGWVETRWLPGGQD